MYKYIHEKVLWRAFVQNDALCWEHRDKHTIWLSLITRRKRIADGSGTSIVEVNRLVKQFEETSKMMRMMTTGGGKKLMRMAGAMKRR